MQHNMLSLGESMNIILTGESSRCFSAPVSPLCYVLACVGVHMRHLASHFCNTYEFVHVSLKKDFSKHYRLTSYKRNMSQELATLSMGATSKLTI
jgi:hypothetical protein